ncbi:MAG: glutamate synthase subunit beta [Methylacidiphilales bacterium]|nr:glutamate synthase subunit beta [Candidatus Methylacidiphilales bacterium]
MGKPTGFIEFKREVAADRPPMERIGDWNEFHLDLTEEKIKTQSARCMDCGIPFCHAGMVINGAAAGCPLSNLIPEWNDLVYRGLWREALQRLHETNNFPEFTARVCPAPCEGSCTLGSIETPVTVRSIEAAVVEKGWEEGWLAPEIPQVSTGKKIAVVGSGPAGLSAAAQLNQAGHAVTVFERADRPGGLLMYGIPNMKLDKELVLLRRIRKLKAEGIHFICNTEIGKNYSADRLLREFSAVVLCIGSTRPRDLPIEGRNAAGVHFAMEYLATNTHAVLDHTRDFIDARNHDVVIIGGGDTGTDCVGTAVRQGARSIAQLEILPAPPLERGADNPWPEWPRFLRTDYGHVEARARYGDDPRVFSTSAIKFESDKDGHVSAVHAVKVEWKKNDKGQFVYREIPGSGKTYPAQMVLIAMGFLGPEPPLLKTLGVERDPRSNIKTEPAKRYQTSLPNVFAAGDCRRGQSLVAWAIQEGRGAARACDEFLMGRTSLP